jgi:hypothetical protein
MTPAMAAATAAAGGAAAAGDMVGCFTLIKRQGVVNGAAAATGRAGRSRAAAAAAAAGTAGSSDTAMVIMTDGKCFVRFEDWSFSTCDPVFHTTNTEGIVKAGQQLQVMLL